MGFSDAVASAGPYANNLHLAPDRQTDVDQHLIAQFLQSIDALPYAQPCQSTEGILLAATFQGC